MNSGAAAVGFFGKLPCRGDFLRRRVRADFVDAWDQWLGQCLEDSRKQLQDHWLDAYLTAPVWRFVLSEGVCGTGTYAGVLVPSVDRVGRYFPMTIVAQWNGDESALDIACGAREWFDAVEDLAVEIPDTTDPDAFDERVAELAELIDSRAASESVHLRKMLGHTEFPHGRSQWHVPLGSVDSLQRAVNAFAMREMERTLRPLSLWWSDGSETQGASWLCVSGLPASTSFSAMLSGRWSGPGWHTLGTTESSTANGGNSAKAPSGVEAALSNMSAAPASDAVRAGSTPPSVSARLNVKALHEEISHDTGSLSDTHFVARPEVGLWGVVVSTATAQSFADALQGVEDNESLTVVVERVRRAIVDTRLRLEQEDPDACEDVGVLVFVSRGPECALVFAGPVQGFRLRSGRAFPVIGIAGSIDEANNTIPVSLNGADIGLLDLLNGPSRPATSGSAEAGVSVRYESMDAGDGWLLIGSALVSDKGLNRIAALRAAEPQDSALALKAMRDACIPHTESERKPLPLMLLSVAQG